MKIIGLTGKMGAGKSTVLELLKEVEQQDVRLVKLAAPLYDMQEMIYKRISPVYTRPDGFTKDRKLLQFLGTDWARNSISPTLWMDLWKAEVLRYKHIPNVLIVADDVRFDNEGEVIKSLGGMVISVQSDKTHERIDTSLGNHSSENGIDGKYIDAIILNNGTIQDLKDSIYTLNDVFHIW